MFQYWFGKIFWGSPKLRNKLIDFINIEEESHSNKRPDKLSYTSACPQANPGPC